MRERKRKLTALAALAAFVLLPAGCGNSRGQENEAAYLKEIDTSGYVTLGEYKGMDLTLKEPEIPEEYLESYIQYVLTNNPEYVEITGRTVQTGDVVNIDYEGKLDGVAFAGGTAKGADLTIGSGQFISGFEDGCIGMEIGQTRDVEARFPDPYKNNPDLAGKTAVFTVTLNGIREVKIPELTDEYVAGLGIEDCETTQEYRAFLRDILIQQQYGTPLERQYELAVEKAEADAEIKDAPEKMVDRMYTTLLSNVTSYAQMYGMDIGTFVAGEYGGEAADYEATLRGQARTMARRYLLLQAIAKKEGLEVSEAELEQEIAADAEDYGYETADDYREAIDVEAFREYLMTQKVIQFMVDNAAPKAAD